MTATDPTRKTDSFASRLSTIEAHTTLAVVSWALTMFLFRHSLSGLVALALQDERYSHILLVPLLSVFLIYLQRRPIFAACRYSPWIGVPLSAAGILLWWNLSARLASLNVADRLAATVLPIVLTWIALFVCFYGAQAFQAAAFPLLFLMLIVPLPSALLAKAVTFLQKESADVCFALFKLIGVPVLRHGFRFSLPGIDIQIAEECSGIRSSLSLLITSLLAGYLFLKSPSKRIWFTLLTIPIVIFKNALRIVIISWLGVYVNRGFFYGRLHHQGGIPFSMISLAMMGLLLYWMRDGRQAKRRRILGWAF